RPIYGDAFFAKQSSGSSASARLILEQAFRLYRPTSIIDVGCGIGPWLCSAAELGIEDSIGIDGDHVRGQKMMFPTEKFRACDLETGRLADAAPRRCFDL